METNTPDKEKWINRVMQSTENITRAEGNPFLYQKVLLKLKSGESLPVSTGLVWLTVTLFILMAILNVSLLTKNTGSGNNAAAVVAAEYDLTVSDTYSSVIDNLDTHE